MKTKKYRRDYLVCSLAGQPTTSEHISQAANNALREMLKDAERDGMVPEWDTLNLEATSQKGYVEVEAFEL